MKKRPAAKTEVILELFPSSSFAHCSDIRPALSARLGGAHDSALPSRCTKPPSLVTVHRVARAPRPATLPRKTLTVATRSNRQRCGEGFGEGKPAGSLCFPLRPVNGYCPRYAGHKFIILRSHYDYARSRIWHLERPRIFTDETRISAGRLMLCKHRLTR